MQKTSENVFLWHLWEWVFQIFSRFHSIMEGSPDTFFNFQFKPYATSKIEPYDTTGITGNTGNCCWLWQQSFVLNVTRLLDPTLKHLDQLRLKQESSLHFQTKKKKKTLETCQIDSKLTKYVSIYLPMKKRFAMKWNI